MYDDMTYSMLVETLKKKFKLEANDRLNLSVKLSSFDSLLDITDDEEHDNKDLEVKIGNTFDNKEALDLAVRLKALEDGYRFLSKKSNPDRGNWSLLVMVDVCTEKCIGDSPNLLFISDRHLAIALTVHNELPLSFHGPDAYNKLIKAGPLRWFRAHCPLIRYNYMTSYSVESVNACTVLKRKLPITMLTKTYHAMVQEWYFKRQEVAGSEYEI
ncbi:hypothetical protein Tco_0991938 [Tanacetum coccineum]|uniref:Uncharacterized protein n=1 Tax=Tanacetum coccineum TaxID=301880 RepID=A0ABQ5F1R7_9ASTR